MWAEKMNRWQRKRQWWRSMRAESRVRHIPDGNSEFRRIVDPEPNDLHNGRVCKRVDLARAKMGTQLKPQPGDIDREAAQREAARRKGLKPILDKRRTKFSPPPTGEFPKPMAPDAKTTRFPGRVVEFDGSNGPVFAPGAQNTKLGGTVMVGGLRGAEIYTLTLVERETCPTSCLLWSTCSGNGFHRMKRWRFNPTLQEQIRREAHELCDRHPRVLIRLHTLGDFPTVDYVRMWRDLLEDRVELNVFGYTAHEPDSEIGAAVAYVRAEFGMRFAVRHSGHAGQWGATVVPKAARQPSLAPAGATVCPAQRTAITGVGPADHCAACGFCWKSANHLVFDAH